MEIREIIKGNFAEGEKVTVNIDGDIITRRVYWSAKMGDLYVTYKNLPYLHIEFWNKE